MAETETHMSHSAFLPDIVFTKTIGRLDDSYDTSFNDVVQYGKFPATLIIKGIKQIKVFSLKQQSAENAVITGLTIEYDGVGMPISHGVVVAVDQVGTVTIDPEKDYLFGVFGRLKNLEGDKNDGRIASIGFSVFDKANGMVNIYGPFHGSPKHLGTSWATFGPIIAFQGSKKDGIGITTLGFVKTDALFPDFNGTRFNANKSTIESRNFRVKNNHDDDESLADIL